MSILPKSVSVAQSSIVLNILWMLFATLFIWFPYIGIISIPCRKGSSSTKYSSPWPQRDYTGIGKLLIEDI